MSRNKREIYPLNWQQVRIVILIRDRFCCTICGSDFTKFGSYKIRSKKLHVMHLDGNTFNNKYTLTGSIFNTSDNNLASGCNVCHRLYDAQLGNKIVPKGLVNNQVVHISSLLIKEK